MRARRNFDTVWFALALGLSPVVGAETQWVLPAQDQGLPYTRSAQAAAVARIKDSIALFAGSRYAWVRGYKVRLDEQHWRDEAMLRDGRLLVPAAFAGVLDLTEVKPAPAPDYLADRWVYSLRIPKVKAPAIHMDGRNYVAMADVAQERGLKTYQNARGLLLIGRNEVSFSASESNLLDSVITLFDTPEKFADPAIATRWIPTLKRQGAWTNHVKVTPDQLRLYSGPETKWPSVPQSEYNYSGFNRSLLGSKVPPPGVYPRILFSPRDVPAIAKRIKGSKLGRKSLVEMEHLFTQTWWDTNTSDGQVFQKLASGNLDGLEWPDDVRPELVATLNTAQQFKGQKPGIYHSHVAYVPECLTAMALYCLLTGDEVHGRQAAAAIANYYKLREPLIDQWNALSDSEFGSVENQGNGGTTAWRGMHGLVAHMNLGLALDFGGRWMTAEEKDLMRRVIAKATYGRRAYGQDGTVRFRDVNWVGWDLPQFLALTAIEGLEGFDREAWESNRDTVRAFCDWGIDDAGVVYESNGKTAGSFQFIALSMVSLARRGENLFGHPHFRKLLVGQTQMTSPNGRVTVNSGTQYAPYSRQPLSPQLVAELESFYPQERVADYLLTKFTESASSVDESTRGWVVQSFDAVTYRQQVKDMSRLRLPSPTYPGFVPGVLYDADFEATTRSDLDLPLDFNAPVQGVFSSYSDRTTNAVWMNMMVRPNHYLGAGHHHADAGMFHFSALGVDWFTQSPFHQAYDGKYFNLVLVDGESQPVSLPEDGILGWNAAATYLGASGGDGGAAAGADLTYAYSFRWLTQPPGIWSEHLRSLGWEVDDSPHIQKIFAGTSRYKMRPWWPNYNYANYIPTCRAPFNPMERVYRSVGLVRGNHPYGFVVDDVKKDAQTRLYQWVGILNGGVWQARVAGLAANEIVLAYREGDPDPYSNISPPLIAPRKGEPLLLVCALDMTDSGDSNLPLMQVERVEGPTDRAGRSQFFDRLVVNQRASSTRYRLLLIPFHAGEARPEMSSAMDGSGARVAWQGQEDEIQFQLGADLRTRVAVRRAGREILRSK